MKNFILLFIFGFLSIQAQAVYPKGQSQAGSTPPKASNIQYFPNDAISDMERVIMENEAEPTLQDEYFLGRAVAANILAIYKPYTTNPALTNYVNLICQTIVINSPNPEIFNGYHALILDSPELNAFSSPGGHIFITKGLIELTDSEDMLAAVIAHELAHIMLKHSVNLINTMRFSDEMAAIADRASALAGGGSISAQSLLVFRNSVNAMMDNLLKNGYSQKQELQADQEAIILLMASGYNPQAILDVLKILQSTANSQRSGFSTTHPSTRERITNMGLWIGNRQVQDNIPLRSARFRNILK
jgi:beta-barrel assembly-enhancing protease